MADLSDYTKQKISDLATTNSPANSDDFIIDTASGTRIINYGDLADAILNKLTSKSYTIGGNTNTLVAALATMNSQILDINKKIGSTSTSSGGLANYSCTGWGTSASLKASGSRNQFLVMADGYLFTVWFSGNSGSTNIAVRGFATGNNTSGTGSVIVDGVSFSRSGSTLTVSTSASNAIAIIG